MFDFAAAAEISALRHIFNGKFAILSFYHGYTFNIYGSVPQTCAHKLLEVILRQAASCSRLCTL